MRASFAIRYAAFYGGFFLTAGILLPFWPLWLENRGLGAVQIGIILALGPWVRVVTNPLVAQIADRSGRAKTVLAIFAGLSMLAFAGFIPAHGFWWIGAVSLLAIGLGVRIIAGEIDRRTERATRQLIECPEASVPVLRSSLLQRMARRGSFICFVI